MNSRYPIKRKNITAANEDTGKEGVVCAIRL
jgi:hypothetical protein